MSENHQWKTIVRICVYRGYSKVRESKHVNGFWWDEKSPLSLRLTDKLKVPNISIVDVIEVMSMLSLLRFFCMGGGGGEGWGGGWREEGVFQNGVEEGKEKASHSLITYSETLMSLIMTCKLWNHCLNIGHVSESLRLILNSIEGHLKFTSCSTKYSPEVVKLNK